MDQRFWKFRRRRWLWLRLWFGRRIGLWLWLWLGIRLRRRIWLWWRRIWVSGRFGRGLRGCRRRIVTAARRENAADANGA